MKTLLLCLALGLTGTAYAAQQEGGQSNNGGAGVYKNGVPQTFYSAGLYTDPSPGTMRDIPGMQELVQFLNSYPNLSALTKVTIMNALVPAMDRLYYRVQPASFDMATRQRILDIYAREKNIPRDSVALFAVTDTNSGKTFLLPDFFNLRTKTQQMAILFHEAYWKLYPKSTYEQVITAETTFQALLENLNDGERAYNFISLVGSRTDQAIFALNQDKASGILGNLLNRKGTISLRTLFGNDYFVCRQGNLGDCAAFAQANLYNLETSHAGSYFLRLLRERAAPIGAGAWNATRANLFLSIFGAKGISKYHQWYTESISRLENSAFEGWANGDFVRINPFDGCNVNLQVSPIKADRSPELALLPLLDCKMPEPITNIFLGL